MNSPQINPYLNQPAGQSSKDDEDEIDILGLVWLVLDQWKIWLPLALIGTLALYLWSWKSTPIWSANAVLQVETQRDGLSQLGIGGPAAMSSTSLATEIEVFKSRSIMGRVVDELDLTLKVEPKFFPFIGEALARDFERQNRGKIAAPRFGQDTYAWGGESIEIDEFIISDRYTGHRFVIKAFPNDEVLLLQSGELIARGKVGETLLTAGEDIRLKVRSLKARPWTEFYVWRVSRSSAVGALQNSVNLYERSRGSGVLHLTRAGEDPKAIVRTLDSLGEQYVYQNQLRRSKEAQNALSFVNEQLPKILVELESAEKNLNDFRNSKGSLAISLESENILGQIVEADQKLNELNFQKSEYELRYKAEHPLLQSLSRQIDHVKQQKQNLERQVESLPAAQQENLRYVRDVEVKNSLYSQFLSKAQELKIVKAGTVGNVRVLDTAVISGLDSLNRTQSAVIGAFLGLMLGIGFILIRHFFKQTVESPDEIEQLGLPVYAVVPFSKMQGIGGILAVEKPAEPTVEAVRGLRTSLHFALLDAKNRSVMITGPSPSVGKSFLAANLATLLAEAGERVLVIDADMRKGTLHKYFECSNDVGLSDVLGGHADLSAAVHPYRDLKLDVLPRGSAPPNPSELLMSDRFTKLMDEADANYDVIVVDTPPVLAVTDAFIVGQRCGATLLLGRQGITAIKEIRYAKIKLEQGGVVLKGAVLNGVESRSGYYNYKYGNYSYYVYDYREN